MTAVTVFIAVIKTPKVFPLVEGKGRGKWRTQVVFSQERCAHACFLLKMLLGGQALNLTPASQIITRGNARSMQNGPLRRATKEPCFPSRDEQKGS